VTRMKGANQPAREIKVGVIKAHGNDD